ncbi:MAG: hypothetical protein IJ697_05825 [Synergistaceae bacterium]|nr:hypothetical protein [Synergistaceae bacterium]
MRRNFLLVLLAFSALLTVSGAVYALTADEIFLNEEPITYSNTEGYNYRTRIYVLSGDEDISSQVEWVNVCGDWYTSRIASDDSLIIEGKLPPYNALSADANKYHIVPEAFMLGEVESRDASGDIVYDESEDIVLIPGIISASMDIEIEVAPFDASNYWLGAFNDCITYSPDSYTSADFRYSVVLTFKTSYDLVPDYLYVLNEDGTYEQKFDEETGEAVLKSDNLVSGSKHVLMQFPYGTSVDIAALGDNFNLPSWLSYDVLSTQTDEIFYDVDNTRESLDVYVKELRIFYNAEEEPENITAPVTGSVRIEQGQFDYDYISRDLSPESKDLMPIIGWDLKFINSILLAEEAINLYADMSKPKSRSLNSLYQKPVSWDISPKDEASNYSRFNIKITSNDSSSMTAPYSGAITFTVSPDIDTSGDYTYSGNFTVFDANGRTASSRVSLRAVLPILVFTEENITVSAEIGKTSSFTLHAVSGDGYNSEIASWSPSDAGDGITFTCGQSGEVITVSVDVLAKEGTYTKSIEFVNAFDCNAVVNVTVKAFASGDISVAVDGTGQSGNILSGLSSDITLNAGNAFGTLSWAVVSNTIPEGFKFDLKSAVGNSAVFAVTAPKNAPDGNYSANITVSDVSGRAKTYTVNWTVKNVPPIALSGDKSVKIDVVYGESADAVLTFLNSEPVKWFMTEDISDDVKISVKWTDLKDGSGEITVTAEPLAVKKAVYTTALYFTDYQSNDVSADLVINVTLPKIVLSPDRRVVLISPVGKTNTESVNYYNAPPKSCKLSPDNAPSAFNLTITSDDSKMTFAIAPYAAAYRQTYDGTVIITDIYGNSANLEISLAATLPEDTLTIAPKEQTVSLEAGETKAVPFEAANNQGRVHWIIGTVPSGLTVARTSEPSLRENDISPEFSVTAAETASGDYSVMITASDDFVRNDAVLRVRVTRHVEPVIDTVVQRLIDNGFVNADGMTISREAFDSESDTSFLSDNDNYVCVIVLRFAVSKWNIYLNGSSTPVATSEADAVNPSAGELVTITPDSDKRSALISISKSGLADNTNYDVTMGVIPEGSTQEVRSSLGTVSGLNTNGIRTSNGGCNSGTGMLMSVLAAAFLVIRKHS